MLGFNYMRRLREAGGDMFNPTPEQREVLEGCKDAFRQAAVLALEARPHEAVRAGKGWGEYEENDAWAAYRMAVMTENYYGSQEDAVSLAKRILSIAGEDDTIRAVVESHESTDGSE